MKINRGVLADVQKHIYHHQSTGWIKKRQIRRVRANVCPHSAIILALTAESTMNKGIEKEMW